MKNKKLLIAISAAALLVAVAFVLLRAGPLAPTRVTVVQVQEGTLSPELFGIGTVEARRSWMVGPTQAGRVLSVLVDVGDAVKAGQLLAEMDPVDLDQRLAALDASYQRAQSAQAATAAQQADAAARRDLAAATVRRNQDLADKNFISSGALDSRLQEKASADAALLAAQANVRGAAQELTRLQAERAALHKQRSNARLLAPADGVVSTRDAEAGSTVVAGQPVLRLLDPGSLWVKLRLDQGRSAGLATGLSARVVLRSQPQTPLSGKVARLELLGDSVTEERMAHVAFDQTPAGVAVGDMAEVTLQLPASGKALVIPAASLQRQGTETGVWRMEAGKPQFAPVRLGARSPDGLVQVQSGLQAGDSVVVYSQKALKAGQSVQVVDALVPTSPAAAKAP